MPKEKKSFKKYAKKHLAGVIETRRKTAKSKKEKTERVQRKKIREAKEAAKEEKEHVDQLERLKDTDPEFYSYLEEEDPTLLEFGKEDMDIVEGDEGSDEETDAEDSGEEENENDGEGEEEEEGETDTRSRISESDLQKIIAAGKPEACVDVFIAAVRELGYPLKEGPRPSTTRKFEEPSLVKQTLIQIGQHISKNVSTLISGKGSMSSQRTRFLVKRFILATIAVIGQGNVDAALTTGLLQSLAAFVPVLHYMKGITRAVLRAALHLCTVPEEAVRVAAYVVVRAVATRATGTRSMYQSTAFKGIFLAMVRTAHQYNIHNQTVVAFLMNCVVDLYGTDLEAAYQHAFVYLRQLAIYLRAALQQQTQANVRAVVNWQYLNALRTWGAVVSTYSDPAQLGPLIHPVVQIATTLMDLFSSPRMFPMHLQIIEVLNHIASRANGVYIPVAPYILRMITSPSVALSNAPSGAASTEPVELQFTLRIKKSQARSNAYHRELWENSLYLLTEHLATHSHIVGFPEAFWAVDSTLKKLRADVKVPKIHSQIANILRHVEANSRRITAKRDQLDFGPCDLTATKQFEDEQKQQGNSLVTFYQGLRQQRVGKFTAKQKNFQEGRVTLESALQGKRKAKKSMKRSRDE